MVGKDRDDGKRGKREGNRETMIATSKSRQGKKRRGRTRQASRSGIQVIMIVPEERKRVYMRRRNSDRHTLPGTVQQFQPQIITIVASFRSRSSLLSRAKQSKLRTHGHQVRSRPPFPFTKGLPSVASKVVTVTVYHVHPSCCCCHLSTCARYSSPHLRHQTRICCCRCPLLLHTIGALRWEATLSHGMLEPQPPRACLLACSLECLPACLRSSPACLSACLPAAWLPSLLTG